MTEALPMVYEGDAPYIFVSYCHKNRGKVMPVLRFLADEGFRIWYDDGIDAGSEWPEVIAEHLEHSTTFLAFISEESLKSHNCKREFNYAIMENKPSIAIWLDQAELTPVMKLQMSTVQAIDYTETDLDRTKEQLRKAKIFESCRFGANEAVGERGTIVADNPVLTSDIHGQKKKDSRIWGRKITYGIMAFGAIFVLFIIIRVHRETESGYRGTGSVFGIETEAMGTMGEGVLDDKDSKGQAALGDSQVTGLVVPKKQGSNVHISLAASSQMSVNQFYDALELLEDRLDILAGEDNYEMAVNEAVIELDIPEAVFGTYGAERIMECYITCGGSLYLFHDLTGMYATGWDPLHIEKRDIKNITLRKEIPKEIEVKEEGDEEAFYIEIALTDAGIEKSREKLEQWGKDIIYQINSIYEVTRYYNHVYINESRDTLYLLSNGGEKFAKLQMYNLEQNEIDGWFDMTVDWNIEWLNTDHLARKGVYQENVDKLDGKNVTALYKISSHPGEWTEGQGIDIENVWRNRLDAFAMPYAMGYYSQDDDYFLAVKTKPDHMNSFLLDSLSERTYECWIQSEESMEAYGLAYHSWEMSIDIDESGRQSIRVELAENVREEFEQFLELLDSDEGLRLIFNDLPYFCDGKYLKEQGVIEFDTLYYSESGLSEESRYLADYFEAHFSNVFPTGYYAYLREYRCSDKNVPMDFWGANNLSDMELMKESILEIKSDAVVGFNTGEVQVYVKLDVNEELAASALELVREIYQKCEFEKSAFRKLYISFIEENAADKERARMIFTKDYFDDKMSVQLSWIFANGRLDRYKETFENILENDAFYQRFPRF